MHCFKGGKDISEATIFWRVLFCYLKTRGDFRGIFYKAKTPTILLFDY